MSGIPMPLLIGEADCRHQVSLRDDASYRGCMITHDSDAPLVMDRSFLVNSSWGDINGRVLGYLMAMHGETRVAL